jgi:catechol 2,3-dioxygenase-like lactoylglutathione lyase family enzyme
MIDHVSIPVRDLGQAAVFYERILAPLGIKRVARRGSSIGFGKTYPELWLNLRPGLSLHSDSGHHVCLRAPTEAAVEAFFSEALLYGGTSDLAPAPYEGVNVTYFGAFIRDLDGNKIEAATFPRVPERVSEPASGRSLVIKQEL